MPRPAKSNLLGQNTIINLEATRPRHPRRESRIRHVLVAPFLHPSVPRASDSSSKPALLELVIIRNGVVRAGLGVATGPAYRRNVVLDASRIRHYRCMIYAAPFHGSPPAPLSWKFNGRASGGLIRAGG